MANLEHSIIAHYDFAGDRFELLVDPDLAYLYKTGQKKELNNILVVEEVFKNARKGERHKSNELQKVFGTTDIYKIAEIIFQKGEVQLTTEQKRKMLEEKKKQVIAILARECIDPRTGAPHTLLRLQNALEESGAHIDPFKPAEMQLEAVIKELRPLIPLKFERVKIAVRVDAEHAQRIYGFFKEYGIQREEWTKDGGIIVMVEMPAGVQSEFYDRLNKLTAGGAQTKIIK